ncbi:hypothetical protein MP228_010198 [Amoeboaphelidium protococcarum]|nr:hypothetical protein MP228_010198 [Amoeboaphelidium protococcarum]
MIQGQVSGQMTVMEQSYADIREDVTRLGAAYAQSAAALANKNTELRRVQGKEVYDDQAGQERVAQISILREEIEQLKQEKRTSKETLDQAVAEMDELEAELEELRVLSERLSDHPARGPQKADVVKMSAEGTSSYYASGADASSSHVGGEVSRAQDVNEVGLRELDYATPDEGSSTAQCGEQKQQSEYGVFREELQGTKSRASKLPTCIEYSPYCDQETNMVTRRAEWFIKKFEVTMRAHHCSEAQMIEFLPAKMADEDLLFAVEALALKASSWVKLKEAFLESQLSRTVNTDRSKELLKLSVADFVDVRGYNAKFMNLRNRCESFQDESFLVSIYCRGLESWVNLWKAVEAGRVAVQHSSNKTVSLTEIMQLALSCELTVPSRPDLSKVKCNKCDKVGHYARTCTDTSKKKVNHTKQKKQESKSSESYKGKCFKCGQEGHKQYECQKKVVIRVVKKAEQENTDSDVDGETWIKEIYEDNAKVSTVRAVKGVSQLDYVPCLIYGCKVSALVDSGAEVSLVDSDWCDKNGVQYKLDKQDVIVGAFQSNSQVKSGEIQTSLAWGDKDLNVKLIVTKLEDQQCIIGKDLFQSLGISIMGMPASYPSASAQDYEDNVSDDEELEIRHRKASCAGIPEAEMQKVRTAWKELPDANQSIPQSQACTHPLTILKTPVVSKKRIYVKQYPIRKALEPDPYPIPRIGDAILKRPRINYMGGWDLVHSYNRFEVAEEDQEKTAITWRGRRLKLAYGDVRLDEEITVTRVLPDRKHKSGGVEFEVQLSDETKQWVREDDLSDWVMLELYWSSKPKKTSRAGRELLGNSEVA